MAVATATRSQIRKPVPYEARGAVVKLFKCRDKEVLLDGPAGTGKSLGCLNKLHLALTKYPGARGLLVRKTRASLTQTVLKSFENEVRHSVNEARFLTTSQSFKYPNGSELVVGGLDDPQKVMSSSFDMIFVNEATDLEEGDWLALTSRLRSYIMPYQQLIADCNPSYPGHWLYQRTVTGQTTRFKSVYADNPAFWSLKTNTWTPKGLDYVEGTLKNLTGVYYKRLYLGEWCAAEGVVYDTFEPKIHCIDRFPIPGDWPAFQVIDFGYANPFVWQEWRRDPEGRIYRTAEIYKTHRTVEDHCATIKSLNLIRPAAIITDHDAEDRATVEKHLGIRTTPADKAVSTGIQAVTLRLRVQPDDKPRMFWFKNALVEVDQELAGKKHPHSSEMEFDAYVWNLNEGKKIGEEPVKKFDHAKDAERYLVMHLDKAQAFKPFVRKLY